MDKLAQVLEFSLALADELWQSGASLERINDTVRRVCYSYQARELSLYSLNGVMFLSAKDAEGQAVSRQRNLQPAGIHLEKLSRLNKLSREVCETHPQPEELPHRLKGALQVKDYPLPVVMLGQLAALACLARLFGGGPKDVLMATVISAVMFLMGIYVKKPWLNGIVYNALAACVAGVLGLLAVRWGWADQIYVLMITNSMVLIPGIPFVKAFSNLLCGNEMNGIL